MTSTVSIQSVLFGVSVLVMMFVVHPLYQSLIAGYVRDKLFALRDELRCYFVENEIPLGEEQYKQMRRLINSYLRFLEKVNVSTLKHWSKLFAERPELKEYSEYVLNSVVASDDVKQHETLKRIRSRAEYLVWVYLVLTSYRLIFVNAVVLSTNFVRTTVPKPADARPGQNLGLSTRNIKFGNMVDTEHRHIEEAAWLSSRHAGVT